MILGIGTDLVRIERFEQLWTKYRERFVRRFFPEAEHIVHNNLSDRQIAQHYAKRFAAKEAFVKAAGVGFGRHIDLKDMWVESTPEGKPVLKITPRLSTYLCQRFHVTKIKIDLSLSDEYPMAQAFVILSEDSPS